MATQPNLPQYQLSKLPDLLASNVQTATAAGVTAMTALGDRLKNCLLYTSPSPRDRG